MSPQEGISAAEPEANGRPSLVQLGELQRLEIHELLRRAKEFGASHPVQSDPHELVLALLNGYAAAKHRIEGSGVLEVLPDGFGFLRSSVYSYLPGADDLYVSPSQIRRFNLKTGHLVSGQLRPPKGTEKYFALLKVGKINGRASESRDDAIDFEHLGVRTADERLRLDESEHATVRALDFLAPLGKGHRSLLVAPRRSGKTTLMREFAATMGRVHPEMHTMVALLDQRPEEMADLLSELRSDKCDVIASTFDESSARHIHAAELTIDRAKRLVEDGRDVLVLLDSLSALARAYGSELPVANKPGPANQHGLALQRTKRLFAAARKTEHGGSLTVVASVRSGTGSRLDETLLDELGNVANQTIQLDEFLASRHRYPALDIAHTDTRREELLLEQAEIETRRQRRRQLADLDPETAITQLLEAV